MARTRKVEKRKARYEAAIHFNASILSRDEITISFENNDWKANNGAGKQTNVTFTLYTHDFNELIRAVRKGLKQEIAHANQRLVSLEKTITDDVGF